MEVKVYDLELTDCYKPELVEKDTLYCSADNMTTPEAITEMLNETLHMNRLAEERAVMIAFTADMTPIGIFELGRGTINLCLFGTREMLIRALLAGAACIVIAHNHPSGSVDPSPADEAVLNQIKDALNTMGIALADYIIIGDGYFSYKKSGLTE